jgi:hypothetical protein
VVSGRRDFTALIWDLTGLGPGERWGPKHSLKELWQALADGDVAVAHRAGWKLILSSRKAVALLRERLKPVQRVSPQHLARLVAALEDRSFRVREKACLELERLDELAIPVLRKCLADKPSLEMRRRAEDLLAKLQSPALSPHALREIRALSVLERIGTAEARQLLEAIAAGAPGVRLTVEAKAALEYLQRPRPK